MCGPALHCIGIQERFVRRYSPIYTAARFKEIYNSFGSSPFYEHWVGRHMPEWVPPDRYQGLTAALGYVDAAFWVISCFSPPAPLNPTP